MNKNFFLPEEYFALNEFPWHGLFVGDKPIWTILTHIEEYIHNKIENAKLSKNYKPDQRIHLGEGTIVQEGVQINGMLITGKNCVIGHGVFIRDHCILGDNVFLGHAVEIKHSVILNGTHVAHLNYVGDSILGNDVNISGGAMLANFRFDKKPVAVKLHNTMIQTGLAKFGSVIGDKSNIGVNVVLNPGTMLGKQTIVYPLQNVTGVHTDNEIIR